MHNRSKHRWLIAATALFCLLGKAFGQDLSPADLVNATNSAAWTAGKNNAVYLTQAGTGTNNANIYQSGNASAATPNLARVYQDGSLNLAQVAQMGTGNTTDVLQQGNSNTVLSIVMSGTANQSTLIQNGQRNEILQTITNSQSVASKFVQNGNDNKIQEEIVGQNGRSFQLTQNGNGLTATIRVINQ